MEAGDFWIILLFLILILLSSFLSALEITFKNIGKGRVKRLVEEKKDEKRAKKLLKIIDAQRYLSTTILIWNTFLAVLIATGAVYYWIGYFQLNAGINIIFFAFFIFIILVAAKITAQKMAMKEILSFALKTSAVTEAIISITFPLLKIFGIKKARIPTTEEEIDDEIKMAAKRGEEHGLLEKEERAMIHSVIEFGETIVKEVMVPRIDMRCIRLEAPLGELLNSIIDYGFSRIPVYEKSIDNIAGIAYAKDLLKYIKTGALEDKVSQIMRKPYFVPNSKKIDDLLGEMKKNKISLVVVVDEYGGTDGLATLEDILEEIVGEISDEHEVMPVSEIEKLEDGSYLINAKMIIEDVNDKLNINIPAKEFETIGGFIYGKLEKIPKIGEILEMEDFTIKVEKVLRQRILEVRLIKKHENK